MKIKLPVALTTKVTLATVKLQKNSPHILFGAGIVLMGATVVTACVATLKADAPLTEHREHMDWINEHAKETHPEIDIRREKALAFGVTTGKLARLYAPSVVLGVATVACLTKSHDILHKRNVALTAAYAGLDRAFKSYRERVSEEVGEDLERDIYNDVQTLTVKENGKDVEVKKSSGAGGSPYRRLFDEHNRNWDTNGDYRTAFLRLQQNHLNDQLNAKGIVFLNEVYDALGIERSEAGQYVGWVAKKYNESADGYIDFGIFKDQNAEDYYNFAVHGDAIFLDFNVDGVVSHLLKKY